jgi:hypothetical protein
VSSLARQLSTDRGERWSEQPQRRPGIRARIRVWFRRASLDGLLAKGVTPAESPELAHRAMQLTRARHRRALAKSLEEALSVAQGERRWRTACPPLATRDVRASRSELIQLAQVLRENRDVYASGVALTQRLLTDGTGPLYLYGRDDELWHAARDALAALDGRIPLARSS